MDKVKNAQLTKEAGHNTKLFLQMVIVALIKDTINNNANRNI